MTLKDISRQAPQWKLHLENEEILENSNITQLKTKSDDDERRSEKDGRERDRMKASRADDDDNNDDDENDDDTTPRNIIAYVLIYLTCHHFIVVNRPCLSV